MERRKTENTALRELVDALKEFVDARDRLWTLGLVDRLFRKGKCRDSIRRYDASLRQLREAIEGLMSASRAQAATPDRETRAALLSHEEFTMLLTQAPAPDSAAHRGSRRRRRMTGGPNVA